MTAIADPAHDVPEFQVTPLIQGGYLLLWPRWIALSDDIFLGVVSSLMGEHPENWTLTEVESPMLNHAAWFIEPA